ncbi:hypothetical protein [Carnobacterium pleistocenium]|uniref:hypothetical protein n=1 Tax=Carnobacterium pleistocenium TaxID=181073 RepID=UPI00054FB0AF|nr:hypothetical protein [Carnobacterium pleistocenium]
MKKLKTYLIALVKISLICLAFFLFSPSLKAHAMFSDTTNINMGIKLELGTVRLTADTKLIDPVNFTDGDSVLISDSKLINDGSLTGKLAYKINVTKEDGTNPTTENMSVVINFRDVANEVMASVDSLKTDNYTFAKDSSGNDVIIEPLGEVPVTVKYKSNVPTDDEKLKITVTFRLIQSNATDANAKMFSDEESLMNTVTLVPEVVEEESYWPKEDTFIKSKKGNVTYSMEKMKVVFSEVLDVSDSNKRYIKNLNKAILYIKFPDKESVTKQINGNQMFKVTQILTGNEAIKYESIELNEEHNGMILTFKLDEDYTYNPAKPSDSLSYANKGKYELTLGIEIQKYGMHGQNNYSYYDNLSEYEPYFATRLILSSDLVVPSENNSYTNYSQLPIKLTADKVLLSFKKFDSWNLTSANPAEFDDVQLTNETVAIEVKGGKSGQIYSLLNPDKTFSLWLNSNETLNNAVLNVKILGDAGNTLVISRTLINGTPPSSNKSTAGSTTQSSSKRSMSVPLVVEETEEPTEQVTDSKESVEETNSTMDSSVVDESAGETPIEESGEEELIDETEVTEEVVDSSSADSSVEQTEQKEN